MYAKTVFVITVIAALCMIPFGIAEHQTGYITPHREPTLIPTVEEEQTGYIVPPHDNINLSYNEGYSEGYIAGLNAAKSQELIGDLNDDGVINISDAVLLLNWVATPNERGTTYILR